MAKYRFIKGKLYSIDFLDHCMGQIGPVECSVIGWCMESDDVFVTVTPWIVRNTDEATASENAEPITIVTSTVSGVKEF